MNLCSRTGCKCEAEVFKRLIAVAYAEGHNDGKAVANGDQWENRNWECSAVKSQLERWEKQRADRIRTQGITPTTIAGR